MDPGVRTASSSSARAKSWRVWPSRAGMSEARRATPSCSPSTSGVERRAATMVSGSSAETTAMEKAPRTVAQQRRPGWPRPVSPAAISSSIRWATTSVSVAEVTCGPSASSSARSSAWFSMIPLWMRASRPVQSRWGWAFSAVGCPWVAQRVWPMAAACPPGGVRRQLGQIGHRPGAVGRPGPPDLPAALDHQGHPGRVVAPVLELVQGPEDHRGRRARR
jgi:hypothetical protein